MADLSLARAFVEASVSSVRALMQVTGSPEPSLSRQIQSAGIRNFYSRAGALRSGLGIPLRAVEFKDGVGEQRFAGGHIRVLGSSPQGVQKTAVAVRYVGFRCEQESKRDQSSNSDEPYFLIGVAATNGAVTKRFGPYRDVDAGEERHEAADLTSVEDGPFLTPPVILGVVAMEHDEGSPEEAQRRIEGAIKDAMGKLDTIAQAYTGAPVTNYVIPEPARDVLVGWVAEGATALFGLGDDEVGRTSAVLYDFDPALDDWRQLVPRGHFGPNEYNYELPIDGGSAGKYRLFFKLLITKPAILIQPS